jgi:hypothetical protein
MKSTILYSALVGSLALALATGGVQAANEKDKRAQRTKPQARSAHVQAARPANTGRSMAAQRNVSAAQYRQQRSSYPNAQRRNSSAVNRAPRQASATRATTNRPVSTRTATIRERNLARNERMRERNAQRNQAFRERTNAAFNDNTSVNRNRSTAVNRERNVAINRNTEVNRFRNTNEFRNRNNNNIAINRNRNVTVNRTQNTAFYRGGNVRVTNNWRGNAFRGQRYWAFRNYNRQWHDRGWWRSHYNRIVFVNGGWWYWNAGYWFPAWGYAPSVSYVYDGPIYAYNGLSPDQVTVNVQQQLAAAGYYNGPIDGVLGPMTREAIANFQADNGLAVTSAIDEPTLATMGLV